MVHLPGLNMSTSPRLKHCNDRVVRQRLSKMFGKRFLVEGHVRSLSRVRRKCDNENCILKLILKMEPALEKLFLKRDNLSLLWITVLGGYHESAELLLRFGADVNEVFGPHDPQFIDQKSRVLHALLQMKSSNKNERLIRLITDYGADLNARDSQGRTALHIAVMANRVPMIKLLIRKEADLQARNFRGQAALHIAVTKGQVQVVELLLKKGADVNIADDKGVTPLLEAAINSKANKLVPLLINYGAEITVRDTDGESILHRLSRAPVEHTDLVRSFIETGLFSLEQGDSHYQRQPIHLAAMTGNNDLAKLYLDHGANVCAQMKYGYFPLYLAAVNGKPEVLKTLLEHGADINQKTTYEGRTALHNASENSIIVPENFQAETIRLLLSAGADVLIEDNNGKTPFALINHQYYMDKAGTRLILKNLALKKVCKPSMELSDEPLIKAYPKMWNYYRGSNKELQRAKSTSIIRSCTFFDLLAKCRCKIAVFMRNPEFETKFKLYDLNEFPIYAEDILGAFDHVKRHHEYMLELEDAINEGTNYSLPYFIVRRVLAYTCSFCYKTIKKASKITKNDMLI